MSLMTVIFKPDGRSIREKYYIAKEIFSRWFDFIVSYAINLNHYRIDVQITWIKVGSLAKIFYAKYSLIVETV